MAWRPPLIDTATFAAAAVRMADRASSVDRISTTRATRVGLRRE